MVQSRVRSGSAVNRWRSLSSANCAAVEELKELDDPEATAISERYDAIKAQLDGIKGEDEFFATRSQLLGSGRSCNNRSTRSFPSDESQVRSSAERMTSTMGNLTRTGLDEPNDGECRRTVTD